MHCQQVVLWMFPEGLFDCQLFIFFCLLPVVDVIKFDSHRGTAIVFNIPQVQYFRQVFPARCVIRASLHGPSLSVVYRIFRFWCSYSFVCRYCCLCFTKSLWIRGWISVCAFILGFPIVLSIWWSVLVCIVLWCFSCYCWIAHVCSIRNGYRIGYCYRLVVLICLFRNGYCTEYYQGWSWWVLFQVSIVEAGSGKLLREGCRA